MRTGGSFRIRSGMIAPLTPMSGKSFLFHCVEQGEISKCHGTMVLFRYLLMLMDQSYLISWNLLCLLPSGERANTSYVQLYNLGTKNYNSSFFNPSFMASADIF